MYSLFVCGAPHNKRGFEFTILEGNKMPDGIFQYIDIYDPDKMRDGNTYVIQKINILNKDYILLSKYVGINPSDQKTSRGAYIAAGVLVESPISLSSSITFLSKITNLHTSLKMMRDERNAFKTTFDISKDLQNIEIKYENVAFLANLTYSMSNLNETKKVIFNDIIHSENIKDIDNNLIINEIDNQKKLIIQYQEELEDEIVAHKITRDENEKEIGELKNKIEHLKNELNIASQDTYVLNNTQDDLTLTDKNMRHHHSMPQSATKTSHQHKRHVNTSMRTHSSNINYKRNQTAKKRFSLTTIFLFSLMVIILTFGIYFAFDIFTSTGGAQTNTETIENNSSNIENTPEDSVKKTVVDIDTSNMKQEVEETPLIKDKEPSTLDKLKEMER